MAKIDRCPKCYSDKVYEVKRWTFKSPRSKSELTMILMRCKACRKPFRRTEKNV